MLGRRWRGTRWVGERGSASVGWARGQGASTAFRAETLDGSSGGQVARYAEGEWQEKERGSAAAD